MPEFHGDALIRALRARESLREVPVLVVTAHHTDEFKSLLTRVGDAEILFKPMSAEDLVTRVKAILGVR